MYQNVKVDKSGKNAVSIFVEPESNTQATFSAKSSTINVGKTRVDMVNMSVRVDQARSVSTPECDPCQAESVNMSATVTANIVKGDGPGLVALRTQVLLMFDKALEDYNLGYGLVPPASAVFE